MKTKIIVTFDYECDEDINGIEMIKNELLEAMPGVIGDGEVFINSIEIEDLPK